MEEDGPPSLIDKRRQPVVWRSGEEVDGKEVVYGGEEVGGEEVGGEEVGGEDYVKIDEEEIDEEEVGLINRVLPSEVLMCIFEMLVVGHTIEEIDLPASPSSTMEDRRPRLAMHALPLAYGADDAISNYRNITQVCHGWRQLSLDHGFWMITSIHMSIPDDFQRFGLLNWFYTLSRSAREGAHEVDVSTFRYANVGKEVAIMQIVPTGKLTVDKRANFLYAMIEWKPTPTYTTMRPSVRIPGGGPVAYFEAMGKIANGKVTQQFLVDLCRGYGYMQESWRNMLVRAGDGPVPERETVLGILRDDDMTLPFTQSALQIPPEVAITPYDAIVRCIAWIGTAIVSQTLDRRWHDVYVWVVKDLMQSPNPTVMGSGPNPFIVPPSTTPPSTTPPSTAHPSTAHPPTTHLSTTPPSTALARVVKAPPKAPPKKAPVPLLASLQGCKSALLALHALLSVFDKPIPSRLHGEGLVTAMTAEKSRWDGAMLALWTELEIRLRKLLPTANKAVIARLYASLHSYQKGPPMERVSLFDTYFYAMLYYRASPGLRWYLPVPKHSTKAPFPSGIGDYNKVIVPAEEV